MKINNINSTVKQTKNEFDFSWSKNRDLIAFFARKAIRKENIKLHFIPENEEDTAYLKAIEKFLKKNEVEFFLESTTTVEDKAVNRIAEKLFEYNYFIFDKKSAYTDIILFHSEKTPPEKAKEIHFVAYVTEEESL